MTKSTFAKTKAQIKSYQYYLFWGACTAAVMAGQIFVGAGYQSMSQSVQDLTEMIEIKIELEEMRQRRTGGGIISVSYTHLTLPTKRIV